MSNTDFPQTVPFGDPLGAAPKPAPGLTPVVPKETGGLKPVAPATTPSDPLKPQPQPADPTLGEDPLKPVVAPGGLPGATKPVVESAPNPNAFQFGKGPNGTDLAPAHMWSAMAARGQPFVDNAWQNNMIEWRLKGYEWDAINKTMDVQIQDWQDKGYEAPEIAKTLGIDLTTFNTMAKARAAAIQAKPAPTSDDDFMTGVLHGFTDDSSLSPVLPKVANVPIVPEIIGKVQQLIMGMIPGGTQINQVMGAAMAAPPVKEATGRLGRAVGTFIPTAGAIGGGEAIGGIVGAVAGGGIGDAVTIPVGIWLGGVAGYFLDGMARAEIADIRTNGPMSSADVGARMAVAAGTSAKDAASFAVLGPAGKLADLGSAAAGVTGQVGKTMIREGVSFTAMTATATVIAGQIPSMESLMDNAILMGAAHVGRYGVQTAKQAVTNAYHALNQHWADHAVHPKDAAQRVLGAMTPTSSPLYDGSHIAPPSEPVAPDAGGPARPLTAPAKGRVGTLEDNLYGLQTNAKADDLEARKLAANMDPKLAQAPAEGGYPTLDAKLYDYIERPDSVHLDDHERAIAEKDVFPLKALERTLQEQAAPYIDALDEATRDPNYMHRIKNGEAGKADAPVGGQSPIPQMGGSGRNFSTKAASQKATVYNTLVDDEGNRHVVTEYPGSNAVHILTNGVRVKAYGGFIKEVPEKIVDAHTNPSKTTIDRPVVAKVAKEDTTSAQYPHHFTAKGEITEPYVKKGGKFVKEKEVPEHTNPEHYVQGEFGPGNLFVDMKGKAWKIVRSNTAELEQHTNTRFQKSAVANTLDNINALKRIIRNGQLIDNLKEDPEFLQFAMKSSGNQEIPKDWKTVDAPQLAGWHLHPDLANPINDFLKGGPTLTGKPWLINRIAIGAMFSTPLGLIAHMKNLAGMAFIGRGFDNLNLARTARTGLRAMQEVMTLGPDYIRVLRARGALLSSAIGKDSLQNFLMQKMGQEIARADPAGPMGEFARATGLETVGNVANAYMTGMSHHLYAYGDMLYLQRFYELKEKFPDMSDIDAAKNVEKYLPNYRMSSKVMGSRWLAQAMGDSNIIAFGRFDRGKFNAIGNMFKDLASRASSPQERFDALGRFIAAGFLMTAGAYVMNGFAQWMTGNKDAHFNMGGTVNLMDDAINTGENLVDMAKNPQNQPVDMQNLFQNLSKTFTPAIGTQEALEQLPFVRRDFFTGKPISAGGVGQSVAESVYHAVDHTISPVGGALTNWQKYIQTSLGASSPSAKAKAYDANQAATQATAAKTTAKQYPDWLPH